MRKPVRKFRIILIGGLSTLAITACAPSYQMSTDAQSMPTGYGYSQTGYGYDSSHAAMTTHNSRYGGELRGTCQVEVQTCGFMQVIPVYPVYQFVTAPETPTIPVVEEPPVVIYEPAPEPVIMPEPILPEPPVYVPPPVQHWPDPQTPVIPWTPPRK